MLSVHIPNLVECNETMEDAIYMLLMLFFWELKNDDVVVCADP